MADYYQILGLDKEATQDQIKKQFRQLARECHPDVAGNSEEAVERFAMVREAYEVLIDPEKRALYDNPPRRVAQRIHRKNWRPPGGNKFGSSKSRKKRAWSDPQNQFNLDDIFGAKPEEKAKPRSKNSTVFNRENAQKGTDIHIKVEVPEAIAVEGGTVAVEYRRKVRGDGLEQHPLDEIHLLRIPPGSSSKRPLRVDKMGNAGENGGAYGDLICELKISRAKEQSSRKSKPGHVLLPISIPEAVLGGRAAVQTSAGNVLISIPPRSSSGRKLRLRGKGPAGADLLVELKIVLPVSLDDESLELIRKFADLNPMTPRD